MVRTFALVLTLSALAGAAVADPAPAQKRLAILIPKHRDWSEPPQRTALESRVSGGARVGVGYLCGIDLAEPQSAGPTSSYGHQGTFLGAKVGVSF